MVLLVSHILRRFLHIIISLADTTTVCSGVYTRKKLFLSLIFDNSIKNYKFKKSFVRKQVFAKKNVIKLSSKITRIFSFFNRHIFVSWILKSSANTKTMSSKIGILHMHIMLKRKVLDE